MDAEKRYYYGDQTTKSSIKLESTSVAHYAGYGQKQD